MSNSNKWSTKGKIFISNSIIKEAEIFLFFKAPVTFNMATGLGTFCGGFLRHVLPVGVKGAASFLGSLMQKREEVQNWGNAA